MSFRLKSRPRQNWKPRTKFASAKPRFRRGLKRKGGTNLCSSNPISPAAGQDKPGRRVKPKRGTPRVIHPERSGGSHKRVRLYGAERKQRRAEVFERAGGRCEEYRNIYFLETMLPVSRIRCPNRATQWSHARHAANKCDCLNPDCSIASCDQCHERRHNPKPITVTKKSLKETA